MRSRASFVITMAVLAAARPSNLTFSTQTVAAMASTSRAIDVETCEAGNPFVEGFYADPDNEFYNGEYWVYPTSSYSYDKQTYLDAFSSPDLIHWTKHPNILRAADFTWAHRAVWEPAPISRNGKYYLYFGANDIQSNQEIGGIGVGIADQPQGPYKDAIGKPLIGAFYHGAQPIDQDVFIDDDGQAYIYYGGHSHANVAKLNEDMISLGQFDDGTTFKSITPKHYVEGSQMIKRKGKYYFFWSEGGWTGPDYAVSYAISDSPTGPFPRQGKILQQDPAVATGSGHNGIIHVPGTDIYYIVYHRHPLGSKDGNDRHLAYDRLHFNSDGTIRPVKMLVKDNFSDGNMIGWQVYGGSWNASSNILKSTDKNGGKAILNTNFADFVFEADISITSASEGSSSGSAGLVFRADKFGNGLNEFSGYYASISTSDGLMLRRAHDGHWTQLGAIDVTIQPNITYRMRIRAEKGQISISIKRRLYNIEKEGEGETEEEIEAEVEAETDGGVFVAAMAAVDGKFASGKDGVMAVGTEAAFDNVFVRHLEDE